MITTFNGHHIPSEFFAVGERIRYNDPDQGVGYGILQGFDVDDVPSVAMINTGDRVIRVRPRYIQKIEQTHNIVLPIQN